MTSAEAVLLSLIVPVLNNASGAKQLIQSINLTNAEVLVVDGGSTDGLDKVIDDLNDSRVTLIAQKGCGITDAFNTGLGVASGKYLCCAGADDLWLHHFQTFFQAALAEDEDYIWCAGVEYENLNGKRYVRCPKPSRLWFRMHVFHAAMIVPKSVFQRVGFFDPRYKLAMDSEWVHRAISAGEQLRTFNEPVCRIRLGGVSDVNSTRALKEYRASVITHRLTSPLAAHVAFYSVMAGKFVRKLLL